MYIENEFERMARIRLEKGIQEVKPIIEEPERQKDINDIIRVLDKQEERNEKRFKNIK